MLSTIRHRSLGSWSAASGAGRSAALACVALGALLAAVLLSATLPATAQERPVQIAVVNLDYIVAQSPAGQALQQRLEGFQQEAQAELGRMADAARALRQRAAGGQGSDAQIAEFQRQYDDATQAIQRIQDDKQREGRKMQEEGLKEIESTLGPVFEQIRDEGGYDLILNNVPGVVVMAGERIDITPQVLARLGGTP